MERAGCVLWATRIAAGVNHLYHNRGDDTFEQVTRAAKITQTLGHYCFAATTLDFDNDGWPDIYVACDSTPSILYRNPNIPLGHYVGEVAMYRADYQKAVGEFQDEIRLNPAFAPVRTRAADAASHLARFHDAEVESERSLWLDSSTSEPLIVLAKTLLNQGRDEQAERTLLRTLALDANSYAAHFLLGQVYRKLGKMEMADREFKLAAQIQQAQTKNLPR